MGGYCVACIYTCMCLSVLLLELLSIEKQIPPYCTDKMTHWPSAHTHTHTHTTNTHTNSLAHNLTNTHWNTDIQLYAYTRTHTCTYRRLRRLAGIQTELSYFTLNKQIPLLPHTHTHCTVTSAWEENSLTLPPPQTICSIRFFVWLGQYCQYKWNCFAISYVLNVVELEEPYLDLLDGVFKRDTE